MPMASRMALRIAGAGPSWGNSPMPLAPKPPCSKGSLFPEDVDGRHIFGGGHDVVGHLVVGHAAVLQDDFFIERVADALRDAAFDLASGKNRMNDAAGFLRGPELFDFGGVGDGVDGDLCDLHGPSEGGISFAAILLVVPEDAGRRFVAAKRDDFAGFLAEKFAGSEELLTRELFRQACLFAKHGKQLLRCALDEAADDHGSARGDRRSAVGDDAGVGRGHDDIVVFDAEDFSGDLREHGVGALAEFGAGDQHAHFAVGGNVDAGERIEIAFA